MINYPRKILESEIEGIESEIRAYTHRSRFQVKDRTPKSYAETVRNALVSGSGVMGRNLYIFICQKAK